jgi:hypothetical protein
MKQSSTRELFAYWTRQRGQRRAPARSDIDPAEIRHALGDIFILADVADEQRFRLAGTRMCALFGRELKGEAFASLWSEASAQQCRDVLLDVVSEQHGFAAAATGRNAGGDTVDLELLLLPLAPQGVTRVSAIGALVALETPFWIGARPVAALELGTVRNLDGSAVRPGTRVFAASQGGGRMRRGFMVYQGGLLQRLGRGGTEKAG